MSLGEQAAAPMSADSDAMAAEVAALREALAQKEAMLEVAALKRQLAEKEEELARQAAEAEQQQTGEYIPTVEELLVVLRSPHPEERDEAIALERSKAPSRHKHEPHARRERSAKQQRSSSAPPILC